MNISFGRAVVYTTDQTKSLQFYTQILGCTVIHDGPGPNGLHFIHVGFKGQDNVGLWLFAVDKVIPTNEPRLVLYASNIDELYREIKQKPVTVVRELSSDETAQFFHIADPDGNIIVIVQLSNI